MSAALRLAQLQKERGGEPLAIAVLEKARETGAHMLSGAVLDPRALRDLVPDFEQRGAPLGSPVHHDHVYFLTRGSKAAFPDHAAAAQEPRQLHHLAEPLREVARRAGRSRRHRRLHRLLRGRDPLRRQSRRRRAHRRSRHRPARRGEVHVRAGRRHPRQGDDPHRRRARQPDEGAGPPPRPGRGAIAAAVRARHQGTVGSAEGPRARPGPSSTRWATRCGGRSSAAGSSTGCPTACSRSGS